MTTKDRPLKLIFITPCVGEEFFDTVKRGAHDAAELVGVDCTFRGTEDVDIEAQIQIVREAIESKHDGIAISIVDSAAFEDVIDSALGADIPVIAFNVNARGCADGKLTQVCQDVYAAGEKLAAELQNRIQAESRILITFHSAGISALEERYSGLMKVLAQKQIDSERLVTGMDPGKAADLVSNFLAKNSETKTVIGTGQADTEGAGLAIERDFSPDDYLVAGFDLSPEILRLIESGVVACTVDQQPYIQGFYPVIQLSQMCRYGLVPMNIDAGAALVTPKNVSVISQLCAAGYR